MLYRTRDKPPALTTAPAGHTPTGRENLTRWKHTTNRRQYMKHLYFISCSNDKRYIELTPAQVYEVLRDGYTVTLIK